uniref:Uncharacterized protein n=2 Tax=Hemiselmis andersenii TaxID=464988 RepID=A0A6T8NW19_HEMAN|mmetsp:Transcript_39459/g.91958  ORF Transcript_39459/g.91958 Transcript_39459/m.91958 type:complete len:147 (+) Transcript_39459:22-462(+)
MAGATYVVVLPRSQRKEQARRMLKLVGVATFAAAVAVALLGDDSGYRAALATTKLAAKGSVANKMFGESAGAGYTGTAAFEPDSDADFGIAESNMGGGSLTGYMSDLQHRMEIHKGEVGSADTKQAIANLKLADKKLNMPGIISFP